MILYAEEDENGEEMNVKSVFTGNSVGVLERGFTNQGKECYHIYLMDDQVEDALTEERPNVDNCLGLLTEGSTS